MSSPYVKLGARSLDQWRVTELKEELKRRRLPVKGLKEDLVKRLDEAVRIEMESVLEKVDSCPINSGQSELPPEQAKSQRAEDPHDIVVNADEKVSGDTAQEIDAVDANLVHESNAAGLVGDMGASLHDSRAQNEAIEIKGKTQNGPKSEQTNSGDQLMKHQVSVASSDIGIQVNSDAVSNESVFTTEKNEVTLDFNTDKVNLELDVKHEKEQHPFCSTVLGGGETHPMDVEEPPDKKDIEESIENKVDSVEDLDSRKLGPHEKLNLEGNGGDDSMGEDVMENKKVGHESSPNEFEGNVDNSILHKNENVDIVGHDKPFKGPDGDEETVPMTSHAKRKFNDQEGITNNDALKRPRRLNLEGFKLSEPQIGNSVSSTTPKAKDLSVPTFKRVPGNEPALNDEASKERHVPPSAIPPTSSLRIDQFLRPFTLKAVQELLGKTGTVTSFWMDQIKTHCYVSYSSVEEAIETRDAVYNLRWPTNGGRLLVAEFVDPQEVKSRLDAPPLTPSSATPQPQQSQPVMRERPPPVKERLSLAPPPPAPEEDDPPIVTLDDLFRKTKATPCIYYLPLSDEEVAGKLGKNAN